MLGILKSRGFEITNEVEKADIAVINTCGFLQSAAQESIDCILEVSELKKSGQLRKLVVAGCLVSRYKGDLVESLPEVDAFLTTDEINKIDEAVNDDYSFYDSLPRVLSTKKHTAYLKISEGCNRPCTFCIIPKIRGKMRSRQIDSILQEAEDLRHEGVKEINLVGQDLTDYGSDNNSNIVSLLKALDQQKAIDWIRLLYAYPLGINDEVLDCIANLKSVCEYLDLPLQHSSEKLLKTMKRPLGKYSPRRLIESVATRYPSIHLRTTFIVGFPGETEDDVKDLEDFISSGYFTNLGVFCYSQEEGTPSALMQEQIPEELKQERRDRLMLAQQNVLKNKLKSFIGNRYDVLLEGMHEDTDLLLTARTRFQAPEVDGVVIVNDSEIENPEKLIGGLSTVEISEIVGYDLVGKLIEK
ncbi:UNVERIFIED_CONTAM: hypothetical protein GTU68_001705 [Idotea baltica]|nr:hypothetical protein [Idotea baltica]